MAILKTKRVNIWKPQEDKIFIELLNDLVMNKSLTVNKALDIISEKLKRPKSGCAFRYNKTIRHQLSPAMQAKISGNNPAFTGKPQNIMIESIDTIDKERLEINDFSKINSLMEELQEIEASQVQLDERKKEVKGKLKIFRDYIADRIN